MSDKLHICNDAAGVQHFFSSEKSQNGTENTDELPYISELSQAGAAESGSGSGNILWNEPFITILSHIGHGEKNAVSRRDLMQITGLQDRLVRKCIETMRRLGVIIVSGNSGYYIPDKPSELSRYIAHEEKRARSIFFTLKTARKMLNSVTVPGEHHGE